ncbi:acyl carrier protein [Plantactinospora sp. S1510]|uniref:Acyl carrier protein n=1 Tax=Plantactinospora alkalitolerans TaxID=2789879 RepID=A0ABS0H1K3_9ACTN|nr:acyl carrier protein [Plantactinospora alkalitolerans]MBF9132196.1 acyl carrier protein [Plantactinospora alkalitolerans]
MPEKDHLQTVLTVAAAVFHTAVAPTDDLFDLGADSLTAVLFAERLADETGVPVGLDDVFEASTLRDLAHRLSSVSPA